MDVERGDGPGRRQRRREPELDHDDTPITWDEIDAMHALAPLFIFRLLLGRIGDREPFDPRNH